MKLDKVELNYISGGACKMVVTALTREADSYIYNMPKPDPGTCNISRMLDIPGFLNLGKISAEKIDMNQKVVHVFCECGEKYPEDTFTVNSYEGGL